MYMHLCRNRSCSRICFCVKSNCFCQIYFCFVHRREDWFESRPSLQWINFEFVYCKHLEVVFAIKVRYLRSEIKRDRSQAMYWSECFIASVMQWYHHPYAKCIREYNLSATGFAFSVVFETVLSTNCDHSSYHILWTSPWRAQVATVGIKLIIIPYKYIYVQAVLTREKYWTRIKSVYSTSASRICLCFFFSHQRTRGVVVCVLVSIQRIL